MTAFIRLTNILLLMALALLPVASYGYDARSLMKKMTGNPSQTPDEHKVNVGIDLDKAQDILTRRYNDLTVSLPLSQLGSKDATLHLSSAITPSTSIRITESDRYRTMDVNAFVAYSGTVASIPGSVVALVITPSEVLASVDVGDQNWTMGKDRKSSFHVMTAMKSAKQECSVHIEQVPQIVQNMMLGKQDDGVQANSDTLTLDIAIEADNLWLTYFGNNTNRALAYLARMIAITDEIYRRDLRVRLRTTDIHLWATDDGYDHNVNVSDLIDTFSERYEKENPTIQRDIALFMTAGRANGGGVSASIGGLCEPGKSYCAISIIGDLPDQGTTKGSFDATLIAHEIGHICGGVHTHNCMWIGGPLDSCNASEVSNCVTQSMVRPRVGTIMSYCHRLINGSVDLSFHMRHRDVIRSFLERAACVGNMKISSRVSLSGIIRDAGNGRPLPGVEVSIRPYSDADSTFRGTPLLDGISTCISDEDGKYKFAGMVPGSYSIDVPENFSSVPIDIRSNEVPVNVIVTRPNESMDILLLPAQRITIQCNSQGLRGVVRAYIVSDKLPGLCQMISLDSTRTSEGAELSLKLPVGSYTIVPILKDVEFTPLTSSIAVTHASPVAVAFTAAKASKLGQRLLAIGLRKENGTLHAQSQASITTLVAGASERDRYYTGDDGVVLTEPLKSGELYELYFWADTAVYSPEGAWETYAMGGDTSAYIFATRTRTLPTFTHTYRLLTQPGVFTPLANGIELMTKTTSVQAAHHFDLPWMSTFGNRSTSSMWIYGTGAISFGDNMLPAASNKHTSYADADIVISALTGSLQNDTAARPMSVSYAVLGVAPNRELVVQWKDASIRYMSAATDDFTYIGPFNFQIHMEENSGNISMIYDEFPQLPNNLSSKFSVGIRGCDFFDNVSLQMATSLAWQKPKTLLAHENNPLTIVSQLSKPLPGMQYVWTQQTTGIEDTAVEHYDATATPNPGSDMVSIHVPFEIVRLQMYDLTGKCIASVADASSINVMNIDNGTYIVHVSCRNGVVIPVCVNVVH